MIALGVGFAGLQWRLARGPISLDLLTPLLTAAIQQNFGGQRHIGVGGTMVERDKNGHTSVRLVDVVLRDHDGDIVATAPKVEVGISVLSLLTGNIHARSLRLVGAEVSVRIDANGKVAVFAGSNPRPIAVAPTVVPARVPSAGGTTPIASAAIPSLVQNGAAGFAALLAWVDGLGRSGLDGYELSELGLVDGTLVVDDQREGRHWKFENIDVSLDRPGWGGVEFDMRSDEPDRKWVIRAIMEPSQADRRSIQLEALRVPAKDLLLALRFADLPFSADLPISAHVRGEIGPNGAPEMLQGAIIAESGTVSSNGMDQPPIEVEHAAINFQWDAARRVLMVPMQIAAGGDRYTLLAQVDIPAAHDAPWKVQLGGGSIMIAGADAARPVVINRILARGQIDFARQRIDLQQADLGNGEIGIAMSGGFDYSGPPRLMLGVAARRMSLATLMTLWPSFVTADVRQWVTEHIKTGTVERVDIAVNAPLSALKHGGPPMPNDGLSISIDSTGTALQPVDWLPEIGNADLGVRVVGRSVVVKLANGAVVLPSGRKLSLANGVFSVPDTQPKPTPSPSQARFRLDGPVAAVAELLTIDKLRNISGALLDPDSSRGTVTGQVTLGIPLSRHMDGVKPRYGIDANFTNFSAEHMIMGQRLDAASLRVHADNDGYEIKGDVKIAGSPASMDYRKRVGDPDTEVRLQSVLDEAARGRLGLNLGSRLSGAVPVRVVGHLGGTGKDGRFSVEADLTQASVDELLPGWVKPPAKPAHATFTLVTKPTETRIDNLSLDGSGTLVRGSLDLDPAGNLVAANFPVFSPSPGDKISLKAERSADGTLHVSLRGDVFDGRRVVKSAMAGPEADPKGIHKSDLDLDVKIGAIAGFHGEALRSTELKLSRRNGEIRKLTFSAKIGRDASLKGELAAGSSGRPSVYLETDDAGALLRFTDTYARVAGGHMRIAMDAPTPEQTSQNGTLVVDNFAVRGEAALSRVVAGIAATEQSNVEFTAMHVDFARLPGRLSIHDGVVRGPVIGATIDGTIDYRSNDVRMRGTFVPLYGLNNMFGRLPIVGMLLGGSDEGLVGITYEVVGSTSAPTLRVNPMSAVAPGFIRKFFAFPGAPSRQPDAFQSTR